ncbi:MAG TPA: sigma factor-like helix-turn-helix DNA-binding protein [Solirubrobacteraceae bacterium]|jgi:RNA polymerase sigma factor (sigma-70 family)|nr:sigma factor-like helix-turn-helix DNA-binding protein [Solirubrobacteraceae bacterium]
MSTEPANEDDDDRDADLLGQLRVARGRADGGLHADILLAKLIGRYEKEIRSDIEWRAYTQQPSTADIDEMVQGVRLGMIKDIENVLAGKVGLGAVIGRKIADQTAEFARRRARRPGEISNEALAAVGVEDVASLEAEAADLRARIAALPERDRVFLSERFFGGLRPDEIARRHGVHRRVVDTATSRALKKLLRSDALADQRAVRDPGPLSVDGS